MRNEENTMWKTHSHHTQFPAVANTQFLAAAALAVVLTAATSALVLSAPAAAAQERPDPPPAGHTQVRTVSPPTPKPPDTGEQPVIVTLSMLGITSMHCNCSYIYGDDESMWVFQSEPEIRAVDVLGPSHGKLEKGDVIVAIDGALITTRKGGTAFAHLEAGEPVELTIRRKGRTHEVVVIPRAIAGRSTSIAVPEVPVPARVYKISELADLARSVEELSKRSAELSAKMGTLKMPEMPEIPNINVDFGRMLPMGWIGFGLSFSGSIQHEDEDEPARWRFNEPPTIDSVEPNSPAEDAGLQTGDELLEIDGLKITSWKGGDRFSRMQPGQVVEWKVRRGAKTFNVETTAGERPPREDAYVVPAPSPVVPIKPVLPASQPVCYTGSVAGAEIEIRGGGDMSIEVDKETGEVVITTADSVVRIKKKEKK
jgi:membrane-associated protease RseP (regulator of RpoE activity)